MTHYCEEANICHLLTHLKFVILNGPILMTTSHWSMVLPRATTRQLGGPIHPIWNNAPGVDCLNLLQVVGKCMFMAF